MTMIKIEKSYPVKFCADNYSIFVLGAGGTGGYLVPNLAKIKTLGAENHKVRDFSITLIDGDLVEAKNCKRQMFFDVDVGKSKAKVLAERYSNIYGAEIGFIDSYIESEDHLEKIVKATIKQDVEGTDRSYATPIIVGCVDNNKTRKVIDSVYRKNEMIWIDSGNEETSGQIVCGINFLNSLEHRINLYVSSTSLEDKKDILSAMLNAHPLLLPLPCITEVYNDVMKDESSKFNSELSCAERAISAPQNIFVNTMASQIIMLYLRKILTNSNLNSFCTTFSIESINSNTMFNTKSNLFDVLERCHKNLVPYMEGNKK